MNILKSLTIIFLCCSMVSSLQAQGTTPGPITSQTSAFDCVLMTGSCMTEIGTIFFSDNEMTSCSGRNLSGFASSSKDADSLGMNYFSFGKETKARGDGSSAFGFGIKAIGNQLTNLDNVTVASNDRSIDSGESATAKLYQSSSQKHINIKSSRLQHTVNQKCIRKNVDRN